MLIGSYFKNTKPKFKNHYFSGLSFDSRKCKKNNIFFAIKGNTINGNQFIQDAINNGARTIISNGKFQGLKGKVLFLKKKNIRKTLSELAYKIYKKKPKNIIAVTGTNGKSSIADFYLQILSLNKKKAASIGTLGIKTFAKRKEVTNTTLDPIKLGYFLKKLKEQKINNIILEASSHGLAQNRIDGINFKSGIFTNLSHDHLDYHKNLKNYLNAKLYLFKSILKKYSNVITDDSISQYKKIKKISKKRGLFLKTIGSHRSNLNIIDHKYEDEKQIVKINYNKKKYKFTLNLIGKIQIKNLLMAMLAAETCNIKFKKIITSIKKIKPVDGRLERIGKIRNNAKVILDYAHTPEALKISLQNLKDQFKNKKISIVFGCGGERDKFKRSKMGKVANDFCDKIFLTDDNPRNENPKIIRSVIKKKISKSKLHEVPNRERAIEEAISKLKSNEILLVAGKGHENIQDYGKFKKFFSDRECILKKINKKNKRLSKNPKINILNDEIGKNSFSLNVDIRKAKINSKEIKKNDIFFTIKGKKNDGNNYIKESFNKGASIAIVNKINKSANIKRQIKVANSLKFLTKISEIVRNNSKAKIIAITGSCGKTSLKELMGKTFSKFSKTSISPKSFNNKYGVPLSLFNLNHKDDFGIFEVGMDKKGEINNLTKILKPDVGVITNISYAHAKNFKNLKQIALAKSEIMNNIKEGGSIVLNADDSFYELFKKIAIKKKLKIYSFSIRKKNSNIKLNNIKKQKSKYKISIQIGNKTKSFLVSSNYQNFVKNMLAAITVISIFKDVAKLNKNIFNDFKIPEGRGDINKIRINNKLINFIDESYNSNPMSVKSAIQNYDCIKNNLGKKILILGDMLELGKFSKSLHENIAKYINNSKIDIVHVVGEKIKDTYFNLSKNKKGLILKRNYEIIDLIRKQLNDKDHLMIKGSNSTNLYKISNFLKRKHKYVL